MARRRATAPVRPVARPAPAYHAPPAAHQAPPPAQPAYHAPPPAQHAAPAPPPPAPVQSGGGGGFLAGMAGMVAQGVALGTGSALGHRAVDAVLGSSSPEPAQATQAAQQLVAEQAPCAEQAKAFADCMSYSSGDMGACQQYFDAMQQCRLKLQN